MPSDQRIFPRLRVFASSQMEELAEERQAVRAALETLLDTYLFEVDAPASSRSPQQTFLEAVERADLHVGVFGKGYGRYTTEAQKTIEEHRARRAGSLNEIRTRFVGEGMAEDPSPVLWLAPGLDYL